MLFESVGNAPIRKQAAVDEISEGRAILGIGAGISGFAELQIDRRKPARAMREAIAMIRALLRGETFDFHGDVLALNHGRLSFSASRAELPIYVASNGPVGQRMAAETADGIIMQACASVAEVRAFRAGRGSCCQPSGPGIQRPSKSSLGSTPASPQMDRQRETQCVFPLPDI
jgi:hypothetical protein